MRYDLAMKSRRKSATIALAIAACCLSACGAPKVAPAVAVTPSASPAAAPAAYQTAANRGDGPRVSEITVREGRSLAAAWCADLAAGGKDSAMAKINAKASRLDAINVALFALDNVCPELTPKSAP